MLQFPFFHVKLFDWLTKHIVFCFVLMTVAFVAFGYFSLDLVAQVSANARFLLQAGWTGLGDGGLAQFVELSVSALTAVFSYLIFKSCEYVMVQRLLHARRAAD